MLKVLFQLTTPKLNYTIHFQNTGTADAINIFIIDTLESNLLPETFHIISASHTMTPEWLASNVIRFNFNNIYLPDSNANEPGSHGFVEFEIAMEQGLAEGTEIKNRADIYFDTNPAVTTDYALNTIEFTSGITENENSEFTLYPNPTSGICNIQISEKIERVEFVDLNGRVLITTTSNTADLSDLPTGIYFVKVYTENGVTTKKIVKK
ncbi:MAG: T9SS type A sorting domain-containing protein [Crocinitomicaceae bacterium]|nr:T9SS type A sorting domain-containing protein [Crocinitomicaceae bacterium]